MEPMKLTALLEPYKLNRLTEVTDISVYRLHKLTKEPLDMTIAEMDSLGKFIGEDYRFVYECLLLQDKHNLLNVE